MPKNPFWAAFFCPPLRLKKHLKCSTRRTFFPLPTGTFFPPCKPFTTPASSSTTSPLLICLSGRASWIPPAAWAILPSLRFTRPVPQTLSIISALLRGIQCAAASSASVPALRRTQRAARRKPLPFWTMPNAEFTTLQCEKRRTRWSR